MSQETQDGFVVCTDADGRIYLDDTGTGVRNPAEAKHFRTWVDAEAGVRTAELAPTGPSDGWHIEPAPRLH